MKLYSDEEANYLCRDYRDIPFELRQMLFDKILDDNHISQFNPAGKKKRDFSTPASINMFSEAVGDNFGIDSKFYRKEYNKMYDKNVKKKFDKAKQDRKRDDEIAQYQNVLDLLRNPKGEFKLEDLPAGMKKDAYTNALITDINGMLIDLDETKADINKREGIDARMEAEEIQVAVEDTMGSLIQGVIKRGERKTNKGIDTSIVDNPSKASQGQNRRRGGEKAKKKEQKEQIDMGVEEYKNEEY